MLKQFGRKAHAFAYRLPEFDRRINLLTGAVRSAKTWAMIPKLMLLADYPVPVGAVRLLTGVSKQTVYNNVLTTLFDFLGKGNYSFNRQTGELYILNSKFMVVGARDEGSEKYIRGITVAVNYSDELSLMPRSFFQMLLSRMSTDNARFYATTNPDNPFHWIRTDLLDNKELIARGDLWAQHFTLDDNPNLSAEYKAFVRRAYTGLFYQRFVEGKWVMAEGAVYGSSWTDDLLYDEAPFALLVRGGHVDRFITLDYGTANSTCWYDVLDDGNTLWIQDEYYWDSRVTLQQKTDGQYVDDLQRWLDERSIEGVPIICDPSAASLKAEMSARGIWHIDGDNEVLPGIAKVSSLMAQKKIKIRRKCQRLITQLQAYSWDDKACKRGEEKPIKHEDHGPDAIRVGIHLRVPQWRLAA